MAGIVRDLVDSGVESLTVSLLNSYVDGRHEHEIAAIVEELHPGFPVTVSSDVLPEFREYERHADRVHELLRAAHGGRPTWIGCRARCTTSGSRARSTSCAPTPA